MDTHGHLFDDRTPGVEEYEPTASYLSYTVGLGLAILATIASFVVSQTNLLWPPGIPVGLIVLAFAQIGVHLVFFLHLGSGSDSTNNVLTRSFIANFPAVKEVIRADAGGRGCLARLSPTGTFFS